jgi:hypothetical protein
MKKAVFGIIKNEAQADATVEHLQNSGFTSGDISIILPSKKGSTTNGYGSKPNTVGYERHSKAPEGGSTGAAAGGIIGGSLGLLAGIGALAIPGLGAFIAAGPILAALSGSAVGGSLGLLIGWLVGLGIPEYEAKKYENFVKEGHILICVHTNTSEEVDLARDILKEEGVKDISTTAEKAGHR